MRLLFRSGIVLALTATACSKEPAAPVDFEDPAAVTSQLSSVDSAFNTDVFRSFSVATFMLDAAAAPALRPTAALLGTLRPKLERTGGQVFLSGLRQGQKLQALAPQLSVAAEQGQIIPDSVYGRVYEWNESTDQYEFQDSTVSNLNGVRFILYAVSLDGLIFEPVTAIGTLDIIDQSTSASDLGLHVLVKNIAGTTTFLDYTLDVSSSQTSAQATASGSVTNGLGGASNKTLSFQQTLTATQTGLRIVATFALNNPAITLMLNETLTFADPNLVVNADFRIIQNSQTIRTVARITINSLDQALEVAITVYVDGHPVASIEGDPTDPATQWVDAGGEPLTAADLAALDELFDALERFDAAVSGLFSPVGAFGNL